MRHIAVIVVGAGMLVGCPKGGTGTARGLSPAELAPPSAVVEYDRHTVAGPFPLPVLQHREDWQGPTERGGLVLYDVLTYDVTDGIEDLMETVRVFYGPDGYGFLGTVDENGGLEPWEPPQVVLPQRAQVGVTWTDTHTKGGRTSERTCELMAADHCEGGVISVCESRREMGVVVLRDHFCPGQGWVGFEALQRVGAQPPLRMWSETITRDGRVLSGIPVSESE